MGGELLIMAVNPHYFVIRHPQADGLPVVEPGRHLPPGALRALNFPGPALSLALPEAEC